MSKVTPEYLALRNIIQRCTNSKHPGWKDYGGRGIGVCDRWRNSFEMFLLDVGPRPDSEHSIDRINNDGNYEPGNCRWVKWHIQRRNTRINRWLEKDGIRLTVTDWAERLGINPKVIDSRLRRGHSVEEALSITRITYKKPSHCIRGHEFTAENTRWREHGRSCKKCDKFNSDLATQRAREKRMRSADGES